MANIIDVDEGNFQSEVLESGTPVLVDFGAVWCAPCKRMDPIIEELAEEWGSLVKVVKLDVDHNAGLAGGYQVMGVPTLMLFKNGEITERLSGFQPKAKIVKKFGPHLQTA